MTGPAISVGPEEIGISQASTDPNAAKESIPAGDAIKFLDSMNPVFEEWEDRWLRDEMRFEGGDLVLEELIRFDWEVEGGDHYVDRSNNAAYTNLMKLHALTVTGHIARKRPMPGSGLNFGDEMGGDPRDRHAITDAPTKSEMIYYNVDGVGADGSMWATFFDAVQDRSQCTGLRWCLIEVPKRDLNDAPPSQQDELNGARPFVVEYSPLDVQNWWYHNGELQFAILRPQVTEPALADGLLIMPTTLMRGYYLLVKQGYQGLGEYFSQGGWWLWDYEKKYVDHGDWSKTDGRIPLVPFFSEMSKGIHGHPAIARPQLTELGQLSISIMNLESARDYDAFNAAMSKTYLLGVDPKAAQVVVETSKDSQIVSVPPVMLDDGKVGIPTIYDGSQGAVAASVFKSVLEQKWESAQRLMISKASSTPNSSGRSKQAGFTEGSSPLLVRMASMREQAENGVLYFIAKRWGIANPTSSTTYPSDFDLAPLIDDIDAMFDTLRRAGASSPMLIADLILRALKDRKLVDDALDIEQVKNELVASLTAVQAQKTARTAVLSSLTGGGGGSSGEPGTTASVATEAAGGPAAGGTSVIAARGFSPKPLDVASSSVGL